MRILSLALSLALTCAFAPLRISETDAQSHPKTTRKELHYACPMHPDVTSSKPGKCPRCGMTLRLVSDAPEAAAPIPNSQSQDTKQNLSFSSSTIPDVRVLDQNGKLISFYSDLIKDQTVAINFIFTTCTTICPPLTATFRRVQRELDRSGKNVHLISVSVDPTVDTPERLSDFAAKFDAGPGWTFVTGDRSEIDRLLGALGVAVANKNDHTPMILIGNDKTNSWTRTYGLSSPAMLVKIITDVANQKQ